MTAGALLAGRYRLVSPLGAGELGEVHVAIDQHGERECAVKILAHAILGAPAAWSAFQDACRSASSASTDAIARVTDFGVDANSGRPFFAAERIGFPSVAALIQERGQVPLPLFSAAFEHFAQGLEAAARLGVIHGDLKPQNLFFSPDNPGWARISDFGVGGLRAALPGGSSVALGWSAPEQMQGQAATRASDVFALGLIAFYALTARHYLRAMWQSTPSPDAVLAELTAPRAPASQHALALGSALSPALDEWFSRALHPDPARRFPNALDAYTALAGSAGGVTAAFPEGTIGVAAAIAKPLVFQDLPPRAPEPQTEVANFRDPSLGGTLAFASTAEAPLVAPAAPPVPPPDPSQGVGPTRDEPARGAFAVAPATAAKKPPVLLLAAGGAAALLLLALGSWAALGLFRGSAPKPSAAPRATAAPAAKPAAAPAKGAPAPAPEAPRTRARFLCTPENCDWIVCDGKSVPKGTSEIDVAPGRHTCSASRYGYRTAVIEFTAKEADTTLVEFELLSTRAAGAKAAASPAPAAAKTSAASAKAVTGSSNKTGTSTKSATATAKPAAKTSATATAKPAAKSGKKCGTFINPCR